VYRLTFPIQLPEEHGFFDDGQYPVSPLPGGLALGCMEMSEGVGSEVWIFGTSRPAYLSNESLEDINPVARAGVPAIELWREDVAPAFAIHLS